MLCHFTIAKYQRSKTSRCVQFSRWSKIQNKIQRTLCSCIRYEQCLWSGLLTFIWLIILWVISNFDAFIIEYFMSQIKATDSFVCFTGLNFLFTCFDIAFGFSVLHLAWPELDVMNGKGHSIYIRTVSSWLLLCINYG